MTDKATILTLGIMVIGGFTTGISLRFLFDAMADPDWTMAIWIPLAILGFSTLAFSERIERFAYERIFPDEIEHYQARQEKNRRLKGKLTDDDRAFERRSTHSMCFMAIGAVAMVAIISKLIEFTILDREMGYWQMVWVILTPLMPYFLIVWYFKARAKMRKDYPESGNIVVLPENRPRFERSLRIFGFGWILITAFSMIVQGFACDHFVGEFIEKDHILIHIIIMVPLTLIIVGLLTGFCNELSHFDKNRRFLDE